MKSKILTVLALAFAGSSVCAQTNTPQVINTTGGSSQTGYFIIDWSVGELALVNKMESSQYIVTNGFIQPFTHDLTARDNNDVFSDDEIRILPNPTRNNLEVDFRTKQQGRVKMVLVNAAGKLLYQKEFNSYGDGHIERIDMTPFSSGGYVLKITLNPNTGFTRKSGGYKIIKVN